MKLDLCTSKGSRVNQNFFVEKRNFSSLLRIWVFFNPKFNFLCFIVILNWLDLTRWFSSSFEVCKNVKCLCLLPRRVNADICLGRFDRDGKSLSTHGASGETYDSPKKTYWIELYANFVLLFSNTHLQIKVNQNISKCL